MATTQQQDPLTDSPVLVFSPSLLGLLDENESEGQVPRMTMGQPTDLE